MARAVGAYLGCLALRDNGGDDIFCHRSSLTDGAYLMPGNPVQFEVTFNAQKGLAQ